MLRDLLGGGGQGGSMNRMVGEAAVRAVRRNVLDVLKQVLGQATSGVREGAGRLDEATGASGRARDAIGQATGQSPEELIAKLKDLIANNKLGAGAALGGLGALILGTGAGRALAGSAVRLGGLALIGGLAYKAYQNYQQGLPPLTGAKPPTQQGLVAAPNGSGFEPDAVTHESAVLYIRAMIAAAAADGRIDAKRAAENPGRIAAGRHERGCAAVPEQRDQQSCNGRRSGSRRFLASRMRCRSTRRRALPSMSTATRSTNSWRSSRRRWVSTTSSQRRSMPQRAARRLEAA